MKMEIKSIVSMTIVIIVVMRTAPCLMFRWISERNDM